MNPGEEGMQRREDRCVITQTDLCANSVGCDLSVRGSYHAPNQSWVNTATFVCLET